MYLVKVSHDYHLSFLFTNYLLIKEEFKVIHRGKAYWIRANETPGWVPEFTDDLDEEDDQDDIKSNDDISDIHKMDNTGENKGDFKDKNVDMSEDPFNIYSLLNKNKCTNGNVNNSGSSLKYPPGFTLNVGIDEKDVSVVDGTTRNDGTTRVKNKEEYIDAFSDCRDKCNSNENGAESKISGHFKKSEMRRTGGSIIGLLDEVVEVGQTMGYRMEGFISNMTKIIASQGVEEGYR
ncbi:hypothetical protein Tco_1106197 [Tanacetum coccineum]